MTISQKTYIMLPTSDLLIDFTSSSGNPNYMNVDEGLTPDDSNYNYGVPTIFPASMNGDQFGTPLMSTILPTDWYNASGAWYIRLKLAPGLTEAHCRVGLPGLANDFSFQNTNWQTYSGSMGVSQSFFRYIFNNCTSLFYGFSIYPGYPIGNVYVSNYYWLFGYYSDDADPKSWEFTI